MILFSTIWHTGTHSGAWYLFGDDWQDKVRNNELMWRHCDKDVLDIPADQIVTLYRSPEQVAQSWARRDLFPSRTDTWYEQWDIWAEIVPRAKVYSVSDMPLKLSSHPNKGDFDIPDGLIDHAKYRIKLVREHLPSDLTTN